MKVDLKETITAGIIAAMEAGCAPWSPEWKGAGSLKMPVRSNGEQYRGVNVLILWIATMERGYSSNQWMTFKQAKELGGSVRKGEKGTRIVKYGTFEKEKPNGEKDKGMYLKAYYVFNSQQVDNLPDEYRPELAVQAIDTGARAIAALETFYAATGAAVVHTGGQPCYVPSLDQIHMPTVAQFDVAESYYGTLAHEVTHWSGHKSRLDRLNVTNQKGYAFEELVAELGACFLAARVGGVRPIDRSAAYIQSWLQALKNDRDYIFRAASEAQKAADFIIAEAGARGWFEDRSAAAA